MKMKKIVFFAIAALSLVLTSCSKELTEVSKEKNDGTLLMTLKTSIQQTKATFTQTEGNFKFAFEQGDKIYLNNDSTDTEHYELTRDAEGNFTGKVTAPKGDAKWYAYYPKYEVDLRNQGGTLATAADYFVYYGEQDNVPAGTTTLKMELQTFTSILVIKNSRDTAMDIRLKATMKPESASGYWITGIGLDFDDCTYGDDNESHLFRKPKEQSKGTFYVVVPAMTEFTVYNGDTQLQKTSEDGLEPGKYYEITIAADEPAYPQDCVEGKFKVGDSKYVYFKRNNEQCGEYPASIPSGYRLLTYSEWEYLKDHANPTWTGDGFSLSPAEGKENAFFKAENEGDCVYWSSTSDGFYHACAKVQYFRWGDGNLKWQRFDKRNGTYSIRYVRDCTK